jgi:hypothetical protein
LKSYISVDIYFNDNLEPIEESYKRRYLL